MWHCTKTPVTTVAVVHHLVHTGISKNHCSSGIPSPPPSIAAMVVRGWAGLVVAIERMVLGGPKNALRSYVEIGG